MPTSNLSTGDERQIGDSQGLLAGKSDTAGATCLMRDPVAKNTLENNAGRHLSS